MFSVDVKHDVYLLEDCLQNSGIMKEEDPPKISGAVRTGRWTWALISHPILPPSLISRVVYVDVKAMKEEDAPQESCERRHGRPGLPVPDSPCGLCGRKATLEEERGGTELRNRVKVEVAVVLGHLIVRTVSVDVKQH